MTSMANKPKCPKCQGVMVKIKNIWVCCICKHETKVQQEVKIMRPEPGVIYKFYVVVSPGVNEYFRADQEDDAYDLAKQHGVGVRLI